MTHRSGFSPKPYHKPSLTQTPSLFPFLCLQVWRGGLNNRITVCTSQSGTPSEFGQPRAPIMQTTGGGLLGPEELEVLRPVKQIISGVNGFSHLP